MKNLILSNPKQHYWNKEGGNQEQMDRLTTKFMPPSGRSDNFVGEVIRAINRLYHEFCNNGNGNALNCETIPGDWIPCNLCGGDGVIREEYNDDEEYIEEITCPDCDGEGGYYEDDEYEYSLDSFFENFIKLIREYFTEKNCEDGINSINDIQSIIENQGNTTEYNISKYDRCVDYIVWLVLNDEDNQKPIPEWYENN